jgi:hypothetical protein
MFALFLNKAESEPEPELMIVATAHGSRIRPTNGDELPQLKA